MIFIHAKTACKTFLQNTIVHISLILEFVIVVRGYNVILNSPPCSGWLVSKDSYGRRFACTGGRLAVVLQWILHVLRMACQWRREHALVPCGSHLDSRKNGGCGGSTVKDNHSNIMLKYNYANYLVSFLCPGKSFFSEVVVVAVCCHVVLPIIVVAFSVVVAAIVVGFLTISQIIRNFFFRILLSEICSQFS